MSLEIEVPVATKICGFEQLIPKGSPTTVIELELNSEDKSKEYLE